MGKIAFLCPGQGSQYPGMAEELYQDSQKVQELFDTAEEIKPGIKNLIFNGDKQTLQETKNTQPALFLADYASCAALLEQKIVPDAVAGFSLGEIVALAVAKVLSPEKSFQLVCKRGLLMQEAAKKVSGSMVAVLKMDPNELEKICEKTQTFPVNYNCPGQIVVSGEQEKIEKLKEELQRMKIRTISLPVGGAFHTPYMKEAGEGLLKELQEKDYEMKPAAIPLYGNKTAKPYPKDREEMEKLLSGQVYNSVKFEQTLKNMAEDGIDTFIECGPGTTLAGFVKRSVPGAKIYNVSNRESLQTVVKELKESC
ncbi:MAG: ACP S-malonyltransferase [Lachnospiraceae bacterium]|nr:ACP S-malonyltransferase [Lachnospiraceae bacterium]